MLVDKLREEDICHVWHPYTHIHALEQTGFPVIERAQGIYLYTSDGQALLDGISSWWCVNLGHSHPRLIQALVTQARTLQHCILGGMTHLPVIELVRELFKLTPANLEHVMWASDGSSSVEAALKVALQYWQMQGRPAKNRFISLAEGYHGDTLGAISIGYIDTFHRPFRSLIRPAYQAPSPHCVACPEFSASPACSLGCFEGMENLLREKATEVAAVIVEPLCQAAGGMRIYPAAYLSRLSRLCREYDVLLIVDEIATGFGRTGSLFACDQADIEPDMLIIGKGLTAGYLPMSGFLVTGALYQAFRDTETEDRTFYHGHTYSGNPLAAAVALEALHLYQEPQLLIHIRERATQLHAGLTECADLLAASPVQSLGLIGKIQLSTQAGGASRARAIAASALAYGLWMRPLGDVMYLWPPLTITKDELATMLHILKQAIADSQK